MATRSIVTSQPDVACDVCGRRLLRGEQPDMFLAGGRRRTVCELCAPRATHEGWLRETEQDLAISMPPARPRRGRNLLGRLRQLRESPESPESPAGAPIEPIGPHVPVIMEAFEPVRSPSDDERPRTGEQQPSPAHTTPAPVAAVPASAVPASAVPETPVRELAEEHDAEAPADDDLSIALGEPEPSEDGSWRDAWMFVAE
jgi:hypothetical protein